MFGAGYYDQFGQWVEENPKTTMGAGLIIALIVACLICCCCCSSSSAAAGYYYYNMEGFDNIEGYCSPQLTQKKDRNYY